MSDEAADSDGPLTQHRTLRERFEAERVAHDRTDTRFSFALLTSFGAFAVLAGSGLFNGSLPMLLGGGGALLCFFALRAVQTRIIARRDGAETRRDIHDRHVRRITGRLSDLPPPAATIPPGHPYASDLDIIGEASLLTRIDTTHTAAGTRALLTWLASPAPRETILERQAAVAELAPRVELRQELEAAVLDTGRERLDAGPFVEMMGQKGIFEEKPWLKVLAPLLPLLTVGLLVAGYYVEQVPWWVAFPLVAVQFAIVQKTDPHARTIYAAMGEKKGFVDAYQRLFRVIETTEVEAPLLVRLKKRLEVTGAPPSTQMRRLDRWVSWFELRANGLGHFLINPILLWDLNCLIGIERWMRTVGRECHSWFEALGEVEALASLSVLLHQDLFASLPQIADEGEGLTAEGVAHPLLPADARVANDLVLGGPGAAWIVTGSNMAGKSTLLRAVGVNLVLALAGGPTTARRFVAPVVRVRASMRIADSLQTGASYFQAELMRLRLVVQRADAHPPVFFLLDELLRGTNAKARHIGARAVVKHLLARGAMGLVATHDVALSELEREHPGKVGNVHFTDVIQEGVMTFDYRLREGVVKTSNALRLLAQVGIEVEDDPVLSPESPPEPAAAGPSDDLAAP